MQRVLPTGGGGRRCVAKKKKKIEEQKRRHRPNENPSDGQTLVLKQRLGGETFPAQNSLQHRPVVHDVERRGEEFNRKTSCPQDG